jgi:uncharacterized membrane protein
MIIMALDHVRDYFHYGAFVNDPTDLKTTTAAIFFTRWITHFCAPVFMLLAGLSAFISGQHKSKKSLSIFLLKRGLWLIMLEIVVVDFGWFFNPHFPFLGLQVIWALGVCMIFLAGIIWLPPTVILISGFILVGAHNLLDGVHVQGSGLDALGWGLLHERHRYPLGRFTVSSSYPIIPWIGLMALGYCLGSLYLPGYDAAKRKRVLIGLGFGSVLLFVMIRFINGYGDLNPWSVQSTAMFTLLSFLNLTKYPPSLDYLLMTIGPALLFLAYAEKPLNKVGRIISTYGRVPMFYYLLHIYFAHALAVLAAELTGFGWRSMVNFLLGIHSVPALSKYGFSLPVVYGIWIFIVVALYPACKWYDGYKTRHKGTWWLSYL